jgi:hypothetical protein
MSALLRGTALIHKLCQCGTGRLHPAAMDDDLHERPWLEDAIELGLFYEERIKGKTEKWFQLTWNHLYEGA